MKWSFSKFGCIKKVLRVQEARVNPTHVIGPGPYYPIQKELEVAEMRWTILNFLNHHLKILLHPFIFQPLLLFFSSIPDSSFSHSQNSLEPQNPFTHSSLHCLQQVCFSSPHVSFCPLPFFLFPFPLYIVSVIHKLQ